MRSTLLVLAAMAPVAHADGLEHGGADQLVLEARSLAHDGYCAAALRLAPEIEARDVDAWRIATTEDAHLALCVTAATLPRDPVVGGPGTVAVIEPRQRRCTTTGYLEPSLLLFPAAGLEQASLIDRIAGGVLIRSCTSPYLARLGGTVLVSAAGVGFGFEAELGHRVSSDWAIGGHVALEAIEHAEGFRFASVDARVHVHDIVWFQLGISSVLGYAPTPYSVTAGVGLEGKLGAGVALTEFGIATTLAGLVIYALSQGGWD